MNNIKDISKSMVKALFNPDNKLSLIPNWLNFSRALAGITIPVLINFGISFEVLFGLLLFVCLSDFLDGKVARAIVKKETHEGAMLDAISDKIFSISLMFGLLPVVPSITFNLILEGATSLINDKILADGHIPKSSLIGKIKTWPLFICLALAYTGLSFNGSFWGITPSNFIDVASLFSIISIPLEVVSTKNYLKDYLNPDIENQEMVDTLDNHKEKKEVLNSEKKISYVLNRKKKDNVIVFKPKYEEEIDLTDYKSKQKKIEL